MKIRDAYRYDARAGSKELLRHGITIVDDIGESLWELCRDELLGELGFAADELELEVDRVETWKGPLFVFRDPARVSGAEARELVLRACTKDSPG